LTSFYHRLSSLLSSFIICFIIISSEFLMHPSLFLSSFPMETIAKMINTMILDDTIINESQKGKQADDFGISDFCFSPSYHQAPCLVKNKFDLLLLPTMLSKFRVCFLSLSILMLFYICRNKVKIRKRNKENQAKKRAHNKSVLFDSFNNCLTYG
jgi:hypothetical protein